MILQIPDLLARALPERFGGERLTLAAVYTTRPKFLVFGRDRTRPLGVVDQGPIAETAWRFARLQRLHTVLPELIAEPLACIPLDAARSLHVQGGLPGLSWFALGSMCRTRADWQRVVERSVGALTLFHDAVGEVPGWSGPVAAGDELRWQADLTGALGVPLREATRALISSRARALDALGIVHSPWQHGDFSLNNLLVGRDTIGIIDLEDLGATSVPLHDEIGLALSVRLAAPQSSLSISECLSLCVSSAAEREGFTRAQVEGLVVHHLLWRINVCLEGSRRRALVDFLVDLLNEFTDDAGAFFPREPQGSEPWLNRRVHA